MKKRIKKRIEHLRRQPEHVRLRAASSFMIVGGIALVALWLAVLLPLQLFFQRPSVDEGEVSGAQDVQPSVSPSPSVTPPVF